MSPNTADLTALPASIIFPAKEMKHYLLWQRQTLNLKTSQLGHLPTATQYDAYQRWRKERKRATELFPDPCRFVELLAAHGNPVTPEASPQLIARSCQHALHPGAAGGHVDMCPCCVIEVHMRYMHVLTRALDSFADSCRWGTGTMKRGSRYETVYEAWHSGKVELLRALRGFEEAAWNEGEWQEQHPETSMDGIMSAGKAVQIYWASIYHPTDHEISIKKGGEKSVSFDENTKFEPGRHECYYRKGSSRYEPGRYSDCEKRELNRNDSLEPDKEGEGNRAEQRKPVILGFCATGPCDPEPCATAVESEQAHEEDRPDMEMTDYEEAEEEESVEEEGAEEAEETEDDDEDQEESDNDDEDQEESDSDDDEEESDSDDDESDEQDDEDVDMECEDSDEGFIVFEY